MPEPLRTLLISLFFFQQCKNYKTLGTSKARLNEVCFMAGP